MTLASPRSSVGGRDLPVRAVSLAPCSDGNERMGRVFRTTTLGPLPTAITTRCAPLFSGHWYTSTLPEATYFGQLLFTATTITWALNGYPCIHAANLLKLTRRWTRTTVTQDVRAFTKSFLKVVAAFGRVSPFLPSAEWAWCRGLFASQSSDTNGICGSSGISMLPTIMAFLLEKPLMLPALC